MTIDEAIETVRKFERDAAVNQSSELRRLLLSALTLADEVHRLRRRIAMRSRGRTEERMTWRAYDDTQ